MPDVVWLSAARQDYAEAHAWYLARSRKAAARFEREVERGVDAIQRFPLLWPLIDERHRCYIVKRFPYCIIFRVMPDQIVVIAVAHGRRDSTFWQGREDNSGPET